MVACFYIHAWDDLSTALRNYLDEKSDRDVSQLFLHSISDYSKVK